VPRRAPVTEELAKMLRPLLRCGHRSPVDRMLDASSAEDIVRGLTEAILIIRRVGEDSCLCGHGDGYCVKPYLPDREVLLRFMRLALRDPGSAIMQVLIALTYTDHGGLEEEEAERRRRLVEEGRLV